MKKSAKQRQVEGKVEEVVGGARKAMGAAVGSTEMELKGELQAQGGKAKQRTAKVQEWVKKTGDDATESLGNAVDGIVAAGETKRRH